jgi:hypothetical protein
VKLRNQLLFARVRSCASAENLYFSFVIFCTLSITPESSFRARPRVLLIERVLKIKKNICSRFSFQWLAMMTGSVVQSVDFGKRFLDLSLSLSLSSKELNSVYF